MRPKIAVIDDFSPYSHNLIYQGLIEEELDIIFYGPQKLLRGKLYPDCRFAGARARKVWTPHLYPFQIFSRVLNDKPDIVHIQHEVNTFGPLYTNIFLPFLFLLLRIGNTKTIVTEHAVLNSRELQKSSQIFALQFFGELILSVFYKIVGIMTDTIIVHDSTFKRLLVQHYKVQAGKVSVIPHGVPSDKHLIRDMASSTSPDQIVLFFGVLAPRKGLDYLLQAFASVVEKNPKSVLIIAGEEPVYYKGYKKSLLLLTNCLGLGKKVIFTGFISNEEVDRLFRLSQVVVLPYTYSSSASGPLSTAIQHRKPIIATRTEYFAHVLTEGEDSLLVSSQNVTELAAAITRLLEDESLRTKFSRNIGRKATKYSWSKVAKMTARQYTICLSSRSSL